MIDKRETNSVTRMSTPEAMTRLLDTKDIEICISYGTELYQFHVLFAAKKGKNHSVLIGYRRDSWRR